MLRCFLTSPAYKLIIDFLEELGSSIKGRSTDSVPVRDDVFPNILSLHSLLTEIEEIASGIPLEAGDARFGNPAFKKFMAQIEEKIPSMLCLLHLPVEMSDISQESSEETGAEALTTSSSQEKPFESNNGCSTDKTIVTTSLLNAKVILRTEEERKGAISELATYLIHSFGDKTRIDYGTGHELNFLCFLICLWRLGYFTTTTPLQTIEEPTPQTTEGPTPLTTEEATLLTTGEGKATQNQSTEFDTNMIKYRLVFLVIAHYWRVTRRIQTRFRLEPAGSRGVWGVDDFHFLPFLLGAAQLSSNQSGLTPSDAVVRSIAHKYKNEYLYLEAVDHIFETKGGVPLGECNPILNDISAVPYWTKVYKGFIKMYTGEVLAKAPVMQHFYFGTCIPSPFAS